MDVRVDAIRGETHRAAGVTERREPRRSSLLRRILIGVAVWALIVLAFQQGLQRGIGFSGEEAAVLAGGLGIMSGVLVVILLGAGAVLNSDV